MPYDVQVLEVDSQPLAAARGHAHAPDYVACLFELLGEVWKILKANPQITHRGRNVFLYWNAEDTDLLHSEAGMPIEAGVTVAAPFESTGSVVNSQTPGGVVAMVVHIGPYDKLSQAHAAVRHWCKDNNRPIAGPNWEIYGHWNDDPEKLQTPISAGFNRLTFSGQGPAAQR